MIDTNNPIATDSVLTHFEVYARRANPVQLVIYRNSGDMYAVVGKSAPFDAKVGHNKFPLESPIAAKAGDLVGFYYPSSGAIAFEMNGGHWLHQGLSHSVYFTPQGGSENEFIYSSPRTYSIRVGQGPVHRPKAEVVIHNVMYDGLEKRTEGDEYVALRNVGTVSADLSGWRVYADDRGQDFTFPQGTTLAADQTVRVYTNYDDPQTGGFSYGIGRAIWNNKGDTAHLYDADGALVDTFAYGPLRQSATD
ncbi:MAG: lamin tail domain-containing protein [Myxococcota bacterium]